jgi:hypothetical protein
MSQTTTDNIKFWSFLAGMILMVSVAVLLIDMSIKAAILQESNTLRLAIEGERNDRASKASSNGNNHHSNNSSPILGVFPAGMETGDVANGTKKTIQPRKTRGQRAKPGTPMDSGEIPSGD